MIVFLLKLSLCWGFFALLYHCLLRGETFFRANRAYLLCTLALGVLMAAMAEKVPLPVSDTGARVIDLSAVTIGFQQVEIAAENWSKNYFFWLLYGAVVFVLGLKCLRGFYKLWKIIAHADRFVLADGTRVALSPQVQMPFSFGSVVVLPRDFDLQKADARSASLLAHERAHVKGWHTADVLVLELVCIVFWFHPLAHWYRKTLRTVHEYLADAAATRQLDRRQYGLLLIGQSQSGMPIAMVHHFFQSPLKQRIMMLMKHHSAPLKSLRYGLLFPLLAFFVLAFQKAPELANVLENQTFNFENTHNDLVQNAVQAPNPSQASHKNAVAANNGDCEVKPEFPGGTEALAKYLTEQVKYPEPARAAAVQGKVWIQFTVEKDGSLSNVMGKLDDPTQGDQSLIMEALQVVKSMPKWKPGQDKGSAVACSMKLPILFKLDGQPAAKPAELFDVDVLPQFPGGEKSMLQFLAQNIQYSEKDKKEKKEALAVVTFVIDRDGSIKDVKSVGGRNATPDMNAEVIRVVQLMPKWSPAQKDGQAVAVRFTLPVRFRLE